MNYIVCCIFYLVCPALEQTGRNSLAVFYWQISLGIQCDCFGGTVREVHLFFCNTPSVIFMCDLIRDQHYLPVFLEWQIVFLCPGMLSEISIWALSPFALGGWYLEKEVMAGYRAVCRKNTVDRTILVGELNWNGDTTVNSSVITFLCC